MNRFLIHELLTVAESQQSLISVDQAAAIGASHAMLSALVERGWLRRVRRGVYAVSGRASTPWQQLRAAVLAAGAGAVVSHGSAAAAHGFYGIVPGEVELTVVNERRVQLDGVLVHRSRRLDGADVMEWRGVRLTTPVRTVIDLAARTDDAPLGRILDEGAISRLWTAERVAIRLDHLGGPGRSGTARLRRLLALRAGEGNPDSILEQRVIRILRPAWSPFEVHLRAILDGSVIDMDLAWPILKIDGEVDGRMVRAMSRSKFEREKRRENLLAAHGWRIVHFTSDMTDQEIVESIARLMPEVAGPKSRS